MTGIDNSLLPSSLGITALVVVAAALGAVVRWQLARLNPSAEDAAPLPTGTLVANLSASLALGVLAGIDASSEFWQVVVGVGALGALSTWSTLANEIAELARRGDGRFAAAYLALSLFAGVLLAWVGLQVGAYL